MNQFEIGTLKILDQADKRRLLVAVSGGLDSMVLMEVIGQIAKRRDFIIVIAHVHHGGNSGFRNKAARFVETEAKKRRLEFELLKPTKESAQDEASLRKVRYELLDDLRVKRKLEAVVLAHHQEDLLETRLIRLIRGVGPQGLRAMSILRGTRLRPFLNNSRRELKEYANQKGLEWVEDPTNRSSKYLRNWIRNEWLESLEKKMPGARSSLARSLALLARQPLNKITAISKDGIQRNELLGMELPDQMRVIAKYLNSQGIKNYTRGQIREILRRLDTDQREFTFHCVRREWRVDAQHIRVES